MSYLGTQPNDVKKNTGLYTPSEILQLTKDGSWGGSLELIDSQSWTSTTNYLEFTNLKEDIYDVHIIQVKAKPNGASGSFYYRTSSNGGTSYDSSSGNYQFAVQRCFANGSFDELRNSNATVIELYGNAGSGDEARSNRTTYMYNAGNPNKYTFFTDHSTCDNNSFNSTFGGGVRISASVVNAIQFFTNSGGGFANGEAFLYGVKQI
jgi:hypothetical protein